MGLTTPSSVSHDLVVEEDTEMLLACLRGRGCWRTCAHKPGCLPLACLPARVGVSVGGSGGIHQSRTTNGQQRRPPRSRSLASRSDGGSGDGDSTALFAHASVGRPVTLLELFLSASRLDHVRTSTILISMYRIIAFIITLKLEFFAKNSWTRVLKR